MSLQRYQKPIVAVVAVLAIVALLSFTARERARLTALEAWIAELIVPVQGWVSAVYGSVRSVADTVAELGRLRDENARLTAEIERLRAEAARWQEALAENERLRELLGFASTSAFDVLGAEVVGRNPDQWFRRLVINRGASDGVAKDMPVVVGRRLVGRVIAATPNSATVLLLTDPESGVGGLIQRTRDAGVVLGGGDEPGLLSMRLFSRDARPVEGDLVVTSGLGGVFPPGLIIGHVAAVEREQFGLVRTARVRPAADLDRIEEVLVLRGRRRAGPAESPP